MAVGTTGVTEIACSCGSRVKTAWSQGTAPGGAVSSYVFLVFPNYFASTNDTGFTSSSPKRILAWSKAPHTLRNKRKALTECGTASVARGPAPTQTAEVQALGMQRKPAATSSARIGTTATTMRINKLAPRSTMVASKPLAPTVTRAVASSKSLANGGERAIVTQRQAVGSREGPQPAETAIRVDRLPIAVGRVAKDGHRTGFGLLAFVIKVGAKRGLRLPSEPCGAVRPLRCGLGR